MKVDLTKPELKLIRSILLDHASACMRELRASDVSDVGLLLHERAENARKLYEKFREREDG